MRFILWEQTDDGEIPHEFPTLDMMWEALLLMPGKYLATFVAVMQDDQGQQTTYTIEDKEMEKYYES